MTPYADIVSLLRWLILAGMIVTSVRLWHFRFHARYRVFFVFLLFSSLRSAALMALDTRGPLYMQVWIVTEPVRWILCILLVLELYSLILERHRGLYTAGRWALSAAFAIAVVVAVASHAAASEAATVSRILGFYLLVERGLLFSLVVFLVLILGFLSRYPVELSRNVLLHSGVYSVYFISVSLAFFARGILGPDFAQPVNLALMAATFACVATWTLFLTPSGETETRKSRPAWVPGDEQRLLEQLDSLNAALLRVSRK